MDGNLFLTYLGLEPIIYGVIIILGLATIWWKIVSYRWGTAFIEITIFFLVFNLHGGTMTGGMAAAVAALLGGMLIPATTRVARWKRRAGW